MTPPPPPFDLHVADPGIIGSPAQTKFMADVRSVSAIYRCDFGDKGMTFSIGSGFTKHSAERLALLFRDYKLDAKPLLALFGKRFGWRREWPELSNQLTSILGSH